MAPRKHNETPTQRGTKRKRPTGRLQAAAKQEDPADVISKKLHHLLNEARKAVKKAEVFELRKLVKRLKAARSQSEKGNIKGDDPAEMEKQLDVLKNVDHELFANTALRTKILKDKLLAQNEAVQAVLEEKLSPERLVAPQTPGSAAAKVYGRILSSKTLAEAVHTAVEALREIVDPSLRKGKKTGEEGEEDAEDSEDEEEVSDAGPVKPKRVKLATANDQDDSSEEDTDWESGTMDDGEDADAAGWESGSVDDGDIEVSGSSDVDGEEDEEEVTGEDEDDEDEEETPQLKPKAKPSKAEPAGKKAVKAGESTFLPSLSVGFTRGDSDASEFSDGEGNAADAPRKNRRGQRARRAIWEKKYGKNANHVKKQHEHATQDTRHPRGKAGARFGSTRTQNPSESHSQGYTGAPGRGAPRSRGRGGYGPGSTGRGGGSGANAIAVPAAGRGAGRGGKGPSDDNVNKPLHPSWEAKRRLKEKLNPGIVPAQGKKITF